MRGSGRRLTPSAASSPRRSSTCVASPASRAARLRMEPKGVRSPRSRSALERPNSARSASARSHRPAGAIDRCRRHAEAVASSPVPATDSPVSSSARPSAATASGRVRSWPALWVSRTAARNRTSDSAAAPVRRSIRPAVTRMSARTEIESLCCARRDRLGWREHGQPGPAPSRPPPPRRRSPRGRRPQITEQVRELDHVVARDRPAPALQPDRHRLVRTAELVQHLGVLELEGAGPLGGTQGLHPVERLLEQLQRLPVVAAVPGDHHPARQNTNDEQVVAEQPRVLVGVRHQRRPAHQVALQCGEVAERQQ